MKLHQAVVPLLLLAPALFAQTPATQPAAPSELRATADALRKQGISLGKLVNGKLQELKPGAEAEIEAISWNNGSKAPLDEVLPQLTAFPSLKSLSLMTYPKITDENFAQIGRLTSLEVLYLYEVDASGDRLKFLSGLTNLRELQLGDAGVTDAGLRFLEPLTKLEILELQGNPLTDAAGTSLAHLKNLKTLNFSVYLSHMAIGDKTMQQLKGLNKLKYLGLAGTSVTDAGLAELTGLNLEGIEFGGSGITDKGMKSLVQIKSLKGFSASFAELTDAAMTDIATMENLEQLELNSRGITDVGLAKIVTLKHLHHLTIRLEYTKLKGGGLAYLTKLPELQYLELFPIGNTPFNQFKPLPLGDLADCPMLEGLTLYNIALDDAATTELLKFTKLKTLTFAPGTTINDANLKRLRAGLPNARVSASFP